MEYKNFLNSKDFRQDLEKKWYDYWQKNNFFNSNPTKDKLPFTIVMPPPNITGILHMGHVLNNTIQDVLIRRARMLGRETCWVPGIDHASIATEAKVVEMLKHKGINKKEIDRQNFLKHVWAWKEKYGGIILNQLKRLGLSCDWRRTKFTMDPKHSEYVIEAFIRLHEKGLIYRGSRMIHWDPVGETALSDDEVIYKEVEGKLYHIEYNISGTNDSITVATTRPETIMGDTAICVNPFDERYTKYIGKNALVPLINRVVPIIADEYVKKDFGTGCLKITPAHDPNDTEIAKRHNLQLIDIIDSNGKINSNAKIFVGLDRFEARTKIIENLQSEGKIKKIENYKHKVGFSERTNAIIEPKISIQWFVKMKDISNPALENVLNDNIKFHPNKFKKLYQIWMENIKDWCISRQLWWGHQIPAYYLQDGTYVVAKNIREALEKAKLITKNLTLTEADLEQDEDVLDTWFSSWLWPISVFNGMESSVNDEIRYYYPTSCLVTAPEIIFFWVARMIIAGYEFMNDKPFSNVYFTGIVKDQQKRKMSKSLGNSPDVINLINKYGADAVRLGTLLCAPAGTDVLFEEKLCEQGLNFANKIWNAFKLIKSWKIKKRDLEDHEKKSVSWFSAKLNLSIEEIEQKFKNYKLSEAAMLIYKLVWDDFCSWYLEMIKPKYSEPISSSVYSFTISFFEKILKLVHPFMPYVSEEIWQNLIPRTSKESIMKSEWPKSLKYDKKLIEYSQNAFDLVSKIRRIIKEHNILISKKIVVYHERINEKWFDTFKENIVKLAKIKEFRIINSKNDENKITFNISKAKFMIAVERKINKEDEKSRLEKEKNYYSNFLVNVEKKLNNINFMSNAPKIVIEHEQKKQKDTIQKLKSINDLIKNL